MISKFNGKRPVGSKAVYIKLASFSSSVIELGIGVGEIILALVMSLSSKNR
jgi:hypothetical protein